MLLYFLITCCPFVLFLKFLPFKPLPPWTSEVRLLSLWFWKELSLLSISGFSPKTGNLLRIPTKMSLKRMALTSKDDNFEEAQGMPVLDLPELALECILERLPPAGLCSMAGVCSSLRTMCTSDHLWDKHMKQKWGKILGPAAHREWQRDIASRRNSSNFKQGKHRGWMKLLQLVRPFSWIRSRVDDSSRQSSFPVDSVMSWYVALETGSFWFPAQVYNRENGHVGFMLSCYDAELSYDPHTDTFQARYPPHGKRAVAIENGVSWERLRVPPVDTSPHGLHISDCLNDLHPGDHIEIQWRRNKDFPYGWWYGVVGHLESCDGNVNYCHCHSSDTVVLEFHQYTPGSRWRQTRVNRKDHREQGNEADGFYGGIRKLKIKEEISTWKQLWPTEVLE